MTPGQHLSAVHLKLANPVQSQLQTTFVGRSHTELARHIAKDHDWLLFGDALIARDGFVIADTLEDAGQAMIQLGWFHPTGATINWHLFGPTKAENATTLQAAVQGRQ